MWIFLLFTLTAQATETSEELYQALAARQPKTKAEVLAALPTDLKANFVLVKQSRSLQRGTEALPRIIHFNKNGHLRVTVSGHSAQDDFGADELEILELDRESGEWRFATINFREGLKAPVREGRRCTACHGTPGRALWGDYGHWTNAFGGDGTEPDTLSAEEQSIFAKFVTAARTHEAYRHLDLRAEREFRLTNTTFGKPNSLYTSRVRTGQAESLAKRILTSTSPAAAAALVAFSMGCDVNALNLKVDVACNERLRTDLQFGQKWGTEPALLGLTKLVRLLNLDPAADFRLDQIPHFFRPDLSENDYFLWSAGKDSLLELLGFRLLHSLAERDREIRNLLMPVATEIELTHATAFASSERLTELDRSQPELFLLSLFPEVNRRIFAPALAANNSLCNYLSAQL